MRNVVGYNKGKPGSNRAARPSEPEKLQHPNFSGLKSPSSASQLDNSFYDNKTGNLPGI